MLDQQTAIDLCDRVVQHFTRKGRKWPSAEQGVLFIQTELAEVAELLLSTYDFKRNHPENKEPYTPGRFSEELGDIIYMAIITGITEGVNPVKSMLEKMQK